MVEKRKERKIHKHHILPKSAGGDKKSDTVEVTVEEHAEIHRCLWIYGGRWQDEVAWRTLSGQITSEEAIRLAGSLANKGKPKTTEHKQKLSENAKQRGAWQGKNNHWYGKNPESSRFTGCKHTEETKDKQRSASSGANNPMYGIHRIGHTLGSKRTDESKQKMKSAWSPERRQAQSERMKQKNPRWI